MLTLREGIRPGTKCMSDAEQNLWRGRCPGSANLRIFHCGTVTGETTHGDQGVLDAPIQKEDQGSLGILTLQGMYAWTQRRSYQQYLGLPRVRKPLTPLF
jgi:hypothetical protein